MLEKSLLVIGAEKAGSSTKKMIDEANKTFSNVHYAPIKDIVLKMEKNEMQLLHGDTDLTKFDYCLPRIDAKRAQHGYHVIRAMDGTDIKKPYSAEAIYVAHNKFTTLGIMQQSSVPIPKTYLVSSEAMAKRLFKKLTFPLIIKIVDSFGGRGVILVENESSAMSVISALNFMKQQIIIQEYLKSGGEDIRAYILGGELVAGYKRTAGKNDFRSNMFSGGKPSYTTITGELADIARRAAASVNSDIIAVDMVNSEDGPKVIEANINPGLKGIQPFKNVAKMIVEYIANQVRD